MDTLNYEVLAKSGYNGYILKNAPEKVLQFGEGNFLRPGQDDQRAGGSVHPVSARQ